jgi:hypothetical protein
MWCTNGSICVRESERLMKGAIPLYTSIITQYISFIASGNILLEKEINLHVTTVKSFCLAYFN